MAAARTSSKIREYAESLSIAFILAMIIRCFVLEAFKIPTGSMEPTLRGDPSEGDRILVSKYYYSMYDPQRWEIFVFYCPDAPEKHYIKRLAGKPGEKIGVRNGNLYVDGKIARKPSDVQETMWRKLADTKMIAEGELLYRMNKARESSSAVAGGADRWPSFAYMVEYEEQLRLLENGAPIEGIYASASKRAESLLPRKWESYTYLIPEMRSQSPGLGPWYNEWLREREAAEPKLRKLNGQYLAGKADLVRAGMRKAWDLQGFDVKDNGGLVAAGDSASATYLHKLADGRFNDHMEFITDRQSAWRDRRIGTGEDQVGDIKLQFDVKPAATGGKVSVDTQSNGMRLIVDADIPGSPGGRPTLTLTRDGEKVKDSAGSGGAAARMPRPEAGILRLVVTNVDGMFSAKLLNGQDGAVEAMLQYDYGDKQIADGSQSTVQLRATQGTAIDNIEMWRDVYYTRLTPRSLPGKPDWGKDGVYVLGPHEYLALGDNSPNSRDSRDWGPVPEENVVGKAFFILTPLKRLGFMN